MFGFGKVFPNHQQREEGYGGAVKQNKIRKEDMRWDKMTEDVNSV